MKHRLICILILFFAVRNSAFSQKVELKVKIIDSSFADVADYSFRITVKNIGLDRYWVQDTSVLLTSIYSRVSILIYPYLWKKTGATYKYYELEKRYPATGLDSCYDSCCNCILIKRGDSLVFTLPVLRNRLMEKGRYKMQLSLKTPYGLVKKNSGISEIDSDPIYFDVRKGSVSK